VARAIWTGSITFGLVSISVGLFSATDDHTVHFHQFQRGTSDRVRNQRVNERTGKEVEFADIVKGADVGDGEHVVVEPDELDAIAPGRSRSLEISDFVDLEEIDPIFFQRTYWLAPTAEQYAKPYALLRQAMADGNRAAIGTFVMRGKEYLVAIRADREVLALETLHFADEIRDPATQLENVPSRRVKAGEKELQMASRLIDSMTSPWKPEQYRDTYRDRVEKLIDDKRQGREVVTESEAPEPTGMSDLLEALQRSVEEARGRQPSGSGKARSGKGRAKASRKKADSATPDLGSATKSDLLRIARELDVAGRSSMTRDELAQAVEETGRRRSA
jgi:DNA end-binding protein Ku